MTESVIKIISAFGPFLAALITGLIAILVVKTQSRATLKAAKIQSDTTLAAMSKSLSSQLSIKKVEIIQSALSDLLINLHLIERDPNNFMNNLATLFQQFQDYK